MQYTRKRAPSQKRIGAYSSVTSKRSISVLSVLIIVVALPVTVLLLSHQTEVQSYVATNYYPTLPPGSALPSDATCAAQVFRNSWEPRTANYTANHVTFPNYHVQPTSDPETIYVNRVTGNFTGTTDEIFQWASCKWGIELNWIRAQAVVESDWHQSELSDCNGSPYPELNGCQSLGILQIKGANQPPDYPGTYPYALQSTAFNVDYAMAVRRACFDGKVTWLRNGYKAGDLLGCMGEWFSGDWYSQGAIDYMNKVQQAYNNQTWNTYGAGPAPTFVQTPMPTPTLIPTQTYDPTPAVTSYRIYGDKLAAGWTNRSWNSSVNFTNTSPVYAGSYSIYYKANKAYGGLYLHINTDINTTSYAYLHFAAKASQTGQRYGVSLYDINNNFIKEVFLTNYGGDPIPTAWKVYDIPLTFLNGAGRVIKGVVIQDERGSAEPPLYLDVISLK